VLQDVLNEGSLVYSRQQGQGMKGTTVISAARIGFTLLGLRLSQLVGGTCCNHKAVRAYMLTTSFLY